MHDMEGQCADFQLGRCPMELQSFTLTHSYLPSGHEQALHGHPSPNFEHQASLGALLAPGRVTGAPAVLAAASCDRLQYFGVEGQALTSLHGSADPFSLAALDVHNLLPGTTMLLPVTTALVPRTEQAFRKWSNTTDITWDGKYLVVTASWALTGELLPIMFL